MLMDRRRFVAAGALTGAGALLLSRRDASAVEPVVRKSPARLKLSCCAYSLRQYLSGKDKTMSLEDFIPLCAEWGLDGVELTSYYFDAQTPEYCHRLRRACFLAGLDVSATAIGNSFAVPPGDGRAKQVASVKQWVDLAVEMGAPCMRVFGGAVPKDASLEQATAWAIETLTEVEPHAAQRGIYLALENHGGVTATADGVLAILQGVNSEWVGANLDTGNFHGPDPYEELARVAPYAVNVHVKTAVQAQGKPAEAADYARIATMLKGAGYSGYLSLEYEAAEDPKTAVPRVLGEIRAAIA
ncbi:MAG: sugar phosphate isomerase/epimerase [Armatimonadetes bacterium]|nr:sugar phosphate isomerase/epimerase [Armatimonadota bacterium]